MNYYEIMLSAFTLDNIPLITVGAITFAIGFIQYIYSLRLLNREKYSPFPCWMHTFYVAHDSTWAVLFFIASRHYDWNPLFMVISVAHVVWVLLEIYNLVQLVRFNGYRQEQFGLYFGEGVTKQQAIMVIIGQICAFYTLVNVTHYFIGIGAYMMTAILTQYVMALGPGILWMRRKSRLGGGMGIALAIIASTVISFQPWSMWVIAMPDVFNTAWFYLMGLVCLVVSVSYAVMVSHFPAKVPTTDGKKAIW